MAQLRIYQPAKTAMQSGRGKTRKWIAEFEPGTAQHPDPLMGWCGGGETRRQVRLTFESREAAIAYADKHGLTYQVDEPRRRDIRPKSYSDNFRAGRDSNWTH